MCKSVICDESISREGKTRLFHLEIQLCLIMVGVNKDILDQYLQCDRKCILDGIYVDLKSADCLASAVTTFEKKYQVYMSMAVPTSTEKKRRKIVCFRKISPYLAYCGNYRDSKRNKDGKLEENVLEVTKQAGSIWKTMNDTDRSPWVVKADELTKLAKETWDVNHTVHETQVPEFPVLTSEIIKQMSKSEIMAVVKTRSIAIPAKMPMKDIQLLLISQLVVEVDDTPIEVVVPSVDEINKMKKTEVLSLLSDAKIEVLKKDTLKKMQSVLVAHFHESK
jgi:hypothetical protein